MIPFVAVVSLRNQESRTFRLWIPLFLLWLLLLPLGILLSPLIFIGFLACRVNPCGSACAAVVRAGRYKIRSRASRRGTVVPHSLKRRGFKALHWKRSKKGAASSHAENISKRKGISR